MIVSRCFQPNNFKVVNNVFLPTQAIRHYALNKLTYAHPARDKLINVLRSPIKPTRSSTPPTNTTKQTRNKQPAKELEIIFKHLEHKKYEEVLALYRSLNLDDPSLKGKASGIPFGVLYSLAALEEWQQFEDLVDTLLSKHIIEKSMIRLIAKIYHNYERIDSSLNFLDKVVKYGYSTSLGHIQYLLRHYAQKSDVDGAYNIINWMRKHNIAFTTPVMIDLFKVLATKDQLVSATTFLLEIDNKSFSANGKIFEILIGMCQSREDVDLVIQYMMACMFTWNQGTWKALISKYALLGEAHASVNLFRNSRYKTSDVCNSLVVNAFKLKHPVPLEFFQQAWAFCKPSARSALVVISSKDAPLNLVYKALCRMYKMAMPSKVLATLLKLFIEKEKLETFTKALVYFDRFIPRSRLVHEYNLLKEKQDKNDKFDEYDKVLLK